MISKELGIYIESIRKKRKMSMKELTKDIVSQRQYIRYVNGDSEMPLRVYIELAESLGFSSARILSAVNEEKIHQTKLVEEFYNSIATKKWDKAKQFIDEYDKDDFILDETKMYYEISVVLYHYFQNEITKEETSEKAKEIVNYPDILNKEIYDSTETLVLSTILSFLKPEEAKPLADKLSSILLKDDVIIGEDFYAKVYIIIRLAKYYGMIGNNEKVIELSKNGLAICARPHSYFNNDFLLYYLILSYRNLNDEKNTKIYLKKLYNFLLFKDSDFSWEKYRRLLRKDFGKEFDDMVNEVT